MMQTTQTMAEGLKREFKVVLSAAELEEKLKAELAEMQSKVSIKGFRPGKVPVAHIRRLYGRSVMADIVQNAINDANRQIVQDNNLTLALAPKVLFPEEEAEIEAVMDAKSDLEFRVALEVLPKFEVKDLSGIVVSKQVAELADADVDDALEKMARQNRAFLPKESGEAVESGDRVTIDFKGFLDGEAFEGGTGEGIDLEIGSGQFIPGFEEQLIGAQVDEKKTVTVTFPEEYQAATLAGQEAVFEVTVRAIARPGDLAIDDTLAKAFQMDNLEALREAVRARFQQDFSAQSRIKVKKELLDALDAQYDFELPSNLVEQEFNGVWDSVKKDMTARGATFESEDTTEEKAEADYRRIAERRVRLGLVLAEIGGKAGVEVSDDEVTQALVERARRYPGQEKKVWDHYQKNPQALAEVRSPLFEEKVIDHILSKVGVNEVVVPKTVLFAEDAPSEDGGSQENPSDESKHSDNSKTLETAASAKADVSE